jgi:membrane-associated phospholipid phosphatase
MALLGPRAEILRDWVPLGYLLLGYWMPALFVTGTRAAFERRLLTFDKWLFGLSVFSRTANRTLIQILEITYLFCYPMVPLGFACLYAYGMRDEADRFWTAVLLAVFPCYGVLPWLPTRPPRIVEQELRPTSAIRSLNLLVLNRASVQLNTFPSGHAAASLATALAVGARLPAVGVVLAIVALGIAIGSVVGRYHYAADAITGMALAVAGFAISRIL